ncbi:YbaB/EbfC family nucleoid-associated protein [Williamsia sp. CHRR-6]|uniref:YbaB/EbfC family nucleoid-associated protein n=1 Tax=Williamsia sp. CHRR-6 TaxID=2835871 RepID=UPI001BD9FFE4|nr:YbaB/EbfC family nucleoid-associated protein [Williamsia sp. CHRR-6]MBT0568568.1 YbaB/EbfC family nucleoid-associated protein [Williamsia sp. CHRR-6]
MPPKTAITFDDLEAGARRALDRMQTLSESFARISTTDTDTDELVTVTIDAVGHMTGLTISDAAMNLAPEKLAELVVQVAHTAAGKSFGQMGAQITAFMAAAADDDPIEQLTRRPENTD